jgi:YD repeat-containing protein
MLLLPRARGDGDANAGPAHVAALLPSCAGMPKVAFAAIAAVVTVGAWPFTGALSSGALLLLLPAQAAMHEHDLDPSYRPLHKGYVHLGTGLYIRDEEDLIVRGTPPLILRRTYLSQYHHVREFGVGATHNGGLFIGGDAERFQWVELILPTGTRIRFERTSSGTSYLNAMYEHRSSPSEWRGARLGWTGSDWALRRPDGTLMIFQGCGKGDNDVCWILSERDSDGHRIDYRRDKAGRLLRMEASADRWIAFDYDDQNRIVRAYDRGRNAVQYDYDGRGHLIRVRSTAGREDRYTYNERDEMTGIAAPEINIENTYGDGRVVRQVDRFAEDDEPLIFNFTYQVKDGLVAEVTSARSDGTWKRHTYGPNRYIMSESRGTEGYQPLTFDYERDPVTSVVTNVTLTCPDRKGRPITHSQVRLQPDSEEWIKWDLIRTNCAWRTDRWRDAEHPNLER